MPYLINFGNKLTWKKNSHNNQLPGIFQIIKGQLNRFTQSLWENLENIKLQKVKNIHSEFT